VNDLSLRACAVLDANDDYRRTDMPTIRDNARPARTHLGVPRKRRLKPALLPRERDEKPHASPSAPQQEMHRAARDIERGLVDTDRRQDAGKVFERARERRSLRGR